MAFKSVSEPSKPDPFEPRATESVAALSSPNPGTEAVLVNQKRPSNRALRRQGLLPNKPHRGSVERALLDEARWANRG